jgi:hypothetical protein
MTNPAYCPYCGKDAVEWRHPGDERPIGNSPVCFNCHIAYPVNALPGHSLRELQKKSLAMGMPLREFEKMKKKAMKYDVEVERLTKERDEAMAAALVGGKHVEGTEAAIALLRFENKLLREVLRGIAAEGCEEIGTFADHEVLSDCPTRGAHYDDWCAPCRARAALSEGGDK